MKLHRLPEYILITTVLLAGMGLALYCGRAIGTGQTNPLMEIFAGAVVVAICIKWRTNTWVLIPATWVMDGQINFLAIPFSVRELVVPSVFAMFLVFKALKVVKMKPNYGLIDFLLAVNLFYLLATFVRNPAGVDALGSDRVGGRPYFSAFVSILAYWVLVRVTMSPKQARRIPVYSLLGGTVPGLLSSVTYHFPATAPFLGRLYSGINPEVYNAGLEGVFLNNSETGRQAHLGPPGVAIISTLGAYFRPLTLINPLYLFRSIVFYIGLYWVLISGHRVWVIGAVATFLLTTYAWRRTTDMFKLVVWVFPILILIVAANGILFDLPLPAQRALSFLPGNWNKDEASSAEDSTQWRIEIWREAFISDKYIKNKWFGDGFGYSRAAYFETIRAAEMRSDNVGQENALVLGAFHSGPISTIRVVGVVGLLLFNVLLIYMAIYSWRLIRRCEGTPFFAIALLFGVQQVIYPFFFIFVFGAYENGLPNAVFNAGMLKLIDHSLDVYRLSLNPEDGIPAVAADPPKSPLTRRRPVPVGLAYIGR